MPTIGVDEAGRGPLFGRVYAAAVVLPPDFDTSSLRDSKRFSSQRKREAVADLIYQGATAYGVAYADEKEIDAVNILQATYNAMHRAIADVMQALPDVSDSQICVDGDRFRPFLWDVAGDCIFVPHECIVKGDTMSPPIMAASILAKVARDQYVDAYCTAHPELDTLYGMRSNKGYGTATHRAALVQHGMSEWHRVSFCRRICPPNL